MSEEDGSATVLMLVPVVLSVTLLTLVLAVGGAVLARHQAQAGADLAALAAAGRGGLTEAPDCSAAARVAELNGGRMTGCRAEPDGSVAVSVAVRARGGVFARGLGPARGEARAGPVDATSDQANTQDYLSYSLVTEETTLYRHIRVAVSGRPRNP